MSDTGKFAFAPETSDSVEIELDTQQLKNLKPRPSLTVVPGQRTNPGYDPYNTGAHLALAFHSRGYRPKG